MENTEQSIKDIGTYGTWKKRSYIILIEVQERELNTSKAEAIFKDIMVNNFIKLTKSNQGTYSKAL